MLSVILNNDEIVKAHNNGKINVPVLDELKSLNSKEINYGRTSYKFKFESCDPGLLYLNVLNKSISELHFNIYDSDIKYWVDGGINTLKRLSKSSPNSINNLPVVNQFRNCLIKAGFTDIDINIDLKV